MREFASHRATSPRSTRSGAGEAICRKTICPALRPREPSPGRQCRHSLAVRQRRSADESRCRSLLLRRRRRGHCCVRQDPALEPSRQKTLSLAFESKHFPAPSPRRPGFGKVEGLRCISRGLQRFHGCYIPKPPRQSGIFLKKMLPFAVPTRAQELWNRSNGWPLLLSTRCL